MELVQIRSVSKGANNFFGHGDTVDMKKLGSLNLRHDIVILKLKNSPAINQIYEYRPQNRDQRKP